MSLFYALQHVSVSGSKKHGRSRLIHCVYLCNYLSLYHVIWAAKQKIKTERAILYAYPKSSEENCRFVRTHHRHFVRTSILLLSYPSRALFRRRLYNIDTRRNPRGRVLF